MKLFYSVLAIVCTAQVCLSAPTGDAKSESDDYITDAKIDELKSRLKAEPGMSSSAVDHFAEVLRKFRKDTPEKEKIIGVVDLLSLALQGPTCDKNKIDLKQVLDTNSSESDEKGTSEGITDADMREAQEKLSKVVSGEKVQHAMIILHGFRVGATKEENHAAVLDLVTSAMKGLRTECATS